MKKFILITGSNGLVGFETSKFFLAKGYNVIGIDSNHRRFFFGQTADTTWLKKKLDKNQNNHH